MRVVLTTLIVALTALSAQSQTTYTWTGSTDSTWATATNWNPSRSAPATNDVLVFDGTQSHQPAISANQTVGRIVVTGNTTLYVVNGAATVTLTATGGSTNCFNVSPSVTLTVNATGTAGNGIVTVGTGGGVDSGTVTILGRSQILSSDATNRLVFVNGAVFNASQSTGNPFGTSSTGTTNSVEFKSGSTFNQNTGASNPFAKTAPASVVVFDTGSLYSFNIASTGFDPFGVSLSGRTYPSVTFGGQGAHWGYIGSGASTCTINGDLTISAGDTLYTGTNEFKVSGAITNNGYWNAASGDTVILNGGPATQVISGTGTTVFHQAIFSGSVTSTVLGQNIIDSGLVTVTGMLNAGTYAVIGPGNFLLTSTGAMGLTGPNGVNSAIQTTGTNTLSTGANFSFLGGGPQVTGTLMPDTVNTVWIFTSTGVTLSKTTTINTVNLSGAGSIITGTDTLIAPNGIGGTYGAGAYIDGNLAYNVTVTGAWIFPVGSGMTSYLPVTIDFSSLTGSGEVVVGTVDGSVTPPVPLADSLTLLKRYFKIGNAATITSFTAGLTLSYSAADLAAIGVTKDSLLHVYQGNGSTWVNLPVSARDVVNKTVTVSGVTSFGSFILGVPGPKRVTIAQARKDDNHDLIPDYSVSGDTLKVYGVITTPNIQSVSGNTSYCIQDQTAGIDVFQYGTMSTTFSIGDSVFVIGVVAQYHGLTELSPLVLDTLHFGLVKHNAVVPAPLHLGLHTYAMNAETYESQLIALDTLYKISGSWPASGVNGSVYVSSAAAIDTIQLFISKSTDIPGTKEPKYPLSVVGVVSQYSSGSTLNGGYELIPRDTTDITHIHISPLAVLPDNGAQYQRADTLLFKWSKTPLATKYLFQLSTSSTFGTYVVADSSVTDTTRKVVGLTHLTKYYWRVCAYNVSVFGDFSTIDSVTTIVAAPAAPVLATPLGTSGEPRRTTFTWHKSVNAVSYHLQVASDSTFTTVVFDTTLADTSKKLGAPLASTTKYYWHVSASDTGGTSAYSTRASYTTGTGIDAVNEPNGVPKEFALLQNYPNPFNPSTIIRYDIPKSAYVKVTIYDVLGRVVANLVDGMQTANSYTITWSPAGLSSGIYFCRIQAKAQSDGSSFSAVKKLLFMK
ncbi:MAG TPA: T9SS type A sorting domain-containing protein [Candidatus Kryptonia bacterium]